MVRSFGVAAELAAVATPETPTARQRPPTTAASLRFFIRVLSCCAVGRRRVARAQATHGKHEVTHTGISSVAVMSALDMQPQGCVLSGNRMAAYPPMDEVFRALADPSRRALLDSLNGRNGQTLRELCSGLAMTRQSVSKHLAVLEAANLVTTIRRGREKLHYLNADPINEIGERWITRYERERVQALDDLKHALEDNTMDKPSFVYTTYIQTTPERLWEALTDPAFTERYWGATFDTDWKAGSTMI